MLLNNQMSVKDWVITLIILAIPVVNIIFILIWAFGEDNPRKNYSLANVIIFAIGIGIMIMFLFLALILNIAILS